jgi:hypothetical protein
VTVYFAEFMHVSPILIHIVFVLTWTFSRTLQFVVAAFSSVCVCSGVFIAESVLQRATGYD